MAKGSTDTKYTIHFEPGNINVDVEQGGNLLDAALLAGVKLIANCGGMGTCGTCKVLIEKGKYISPQTDKISDEEYRQGIRQACRTRILSDLQVSIPAASRLITTAISRPGKRRRS